MVDPPAYHFESVIFGRIVAAGDHHGARGLQVEHRVIKQRCRRHADVSHLAAACHQALNQRIAQPRRAQPAVTPQVDIFSVLPLQISPDRLAQLDDSRIQQFLICDAANVVLTKNSRFEH